MNIYVQGNLNIGKQIEHVDTIIENHYSTPQPLQNIEDIVANEIKNSNIPAELNTEQAWQLWEIAIEKGWLNKDLQLMPGITHEKAAIIAERISYKLDLKNRWRPFERYWKVYSLQSKYDRAMANQNLRDFYDAACQAFK